MEKDPFRILIVDNQNEEGENLATLVGEICRTEKISCEIVPAEDCDEGCRFLFSGSFDFLITAVDLFGKQDGLVLIKTGRSRNKQIGVALILEEIDLGVAQWAAQEKVSSLFFRWTPPAERKRYLREHLRRCFNKKTNPA